MMARESARILVQEGTVALLAPSLALLAQTITTWRAAFAAIDVLAVCSDETVTADDAVRASDISAPVTTDPAAIARWLAAPSRGQRLIVSTYRSAPRLSEALQEAGHELDLLIIDEAHHLSGRTDIVTARIAEDAVLPARRRLFMTATPRMDAAAAERHGHLSMDDTTVFGPVLYDYPLSRGIAEGYLEDYRLFIVGIRDSEARAMLADATREYVDRPGAPDLQTLVAQAALVRAAQQYSVRRAITFHHRVAAAAEFATTLAATARRLAPQDPAPHAEHVHGAMEQALREKVLDVLRHPPGGTWSSVSNARCLSEGVDVPAIDAVLFAHPKSSPVDIIQAVGRALRPHPENPGPSTVIVPLIVPEEDGEVGDLDPGDYATLWHVVRALRAHDEPLGIALDQQRFHLPTSNPGLPSKITVRMPPGTADSVMAQVELMLVRQSTSPWWDGLAAARAFATTHGHLDIPLRHVTEAGFRLGQWLVKQRQFHRLGALPADRAGELENLGIVWEPHTARWETGLAAAAAWQQQHGHLDIPSAHIDEGGFALGAWIGKQRAARRRGELPTDRQDALQELGMLWEHHRATSFDRHLAALASYHAEHGDTLVPQSHITEDGTKLGTWVSQMRAKYARGVLPAERVERLTAAGLVWKVTPEAFAKGLAAAQAYHCAHGHLNPPADAAVNGVPLRSWLNAQRTARRRGSLPPARTAALDALGIAWDAPDTTPERLAAARAFRAEHGHLAVPGPYVTDDGFGLGAWVTRCRSRRNAGTLDPQLAEALEELGIVWDTNPRWARCLAAARTFHAAHGHLRPPAALTVDGVSLAAWINGQRKRRRDCKLTADQIAILDSLGMQWNIPRGHAGTTPLNQAAWQRNLDIATRFAATHGHLAVPSGHTSDGLRLDAWLSRQRAARRKGTLTDDQISRLEAIGMQWEPGQKTP